VFVATFIVLPSVLTVVLYNSFIFFIESIISSVPVAKLELFTSMTIGLNICSALYIFIIPFLK
ncbi:MAG: hypothetical protein QM532_00115, partial [Cyanobium sp. MAG06]|nr:hypothetical protein [Cyanobium sp. MAG06]